ncbi:hypothetical protein ACS0TY_015310 [Phlomoides rotata]
MEIKLFFNSEVMANKFVVLFLKCACQVCISVEDGKMMREGPQSAPRHLTQPNATLPFFPASTSQHRPRKRHVPQVAPQQTKIARPAAPTNPTIISENMNIQAMSHKNYDDKLKRFALYQAKATAALNDLMPEFRARPPPSMLTELEDVKRELASARSKEKDLKTTISRLMHKNEVFSARCDSNESQLVALEAENIKTKQELMVADNKYSGASAAGYAEGLKKGKAKWLKSVDFLHHLTHASMQYFDYGFDSCQKQAEQQGFMGQLNKDYALKEAPELKGWEFSDQPHYY